MVYLSCMGRNSARKRFFLRVCVVLLLHLMFLQVFCGLALTQAAGDSSQTAVTYVGIAKYYDNRKCAVTITLDDFGFNSTGWQEALMMLTQKKLYHTVAIITDRANWSLAQYWLDQGFTEAASHSRTHVLTPYDGEDGNKSRGGYVWQIDGSKQDIIGNLTLPPFWRNGGSQYVYAWIEPFGKSDDKVTQQIELSHYLVDRTVTPNVQVYGLASLDSSLGIFNQVGYTVEMGNTPWGGSLTSASSLNGYFDEAYRRGGVYHLMVHPEATNWSIGGYADQHTNYIAGRSDVWYVPFGLMYLYHMAEVGNLTTVKAVPAARGNAFEIGLNRTDHETYGFAYPITYVFNVPENWTSGNVYYRYNEYQPWRRMQKSNSDTPFNGITTARFDYTAHKVYVSVPFAPGNDHIYLQIQPQRQRQQPRLMTISASGELAAGGAAPIF